MEDRDDSYLSVSHVARQLVLVKSRWSDCLGPHCFQEKVDPGSYAHDTAFMTELVEERACRSRVPR